MKGIIISRKGMGREVLYAIHSEYMQANKKALSVLLSDDLEYLFLVTAIRIADLLAKGEEEGRLYLGTHPELTPQQRAIAEEKFVEFYRTQTPKFLWKIMMKAVNTAKRTKS
jgi:hypothetical protein